MTGAAQVTVIACCTPPDLARYPDLRLVLSVGVGHMPALAPGGLLARAEIPGLVNPAKGY